MKMSLVVEGLRSDVEAVGELGRRGRGRGRRADRRRAGPLGPVAHLRPAVRRRRRGVGGAAGGPGRATGRRRRRGPGLRRGRARPRRRGRRRPVGPYHPPPERGPQGPCGGGRRRRGRLGERIHRAHARAGHVDRRGAGLAAVGTACAATARPERRTGHGEDIRDGGARAPPRGERGGPGVDHAPGRRPRRSSRSRRTRRRPRSSSSTRPSSAARRGAATSSP